MHSPTKKFAQYVTELWQDPFRIPIFLLAWGWSMFAISFLFDVALVTINEKEVGYAFAISWSFNYCLLIPLIALLVVGLTRALDKVVALVAESMTVDRSTNKLTTDERVQANMFNLWGILLRNISLAWLICIPMALAISLGKDWAPDVYRPLYIMQTKVNVDKYNSIKTNAPIEQDWSTASLYNDETSRFQCTMFSFLAYTMQVAPVMIIIWLLLIISAFGFFVFHLAWINKEVCLVPDMKSKDRRLGFEKFEPVGMLALLISLLLYAVIWLTLLQNAYLSPSVKTENILSFMSEPARAIMANRWWNYFLNLDAPSLNLSVAIGLMGISSTIIIILLTMPLLVLLFSSFKARWNMNYIITRVSNVSLLENFGFGRRDIERKLGRMKLWPFGYITINTLLCVVFVLVGGALWVRVSLYLIAFALLCSVFWARKQIYELFR